MSISGKSNFVWGKQGSDVADYQTWHRYYGSVLDLTAVDSGLDTWTETRQMLDLLQVLCK